MFSVCFVSPPLLPAQRPDVLTVEVEYGGDVPAPVAVVRLFLRQSRPRPGAAAACTHRAPDRDEGLLLEHVLQALLHQLVGPADELQAVDLEGKEVSVPIGRRPPRRAALWQGSSSSSLGVAGLTSLNSAVTRDPNSHPAPRGLIAHVSMSSGSLHIRSQNGPSCGISQFRSIIRIWSMATTRRGRVSPCPRTPSLPRPGTHCAGPGRGRRGRRARGCR